MSILNDDWDDKGLLMGVGAILVTAAAIITNSERVVTGINKGSKALRQLFGYETEQAAKTKQGAPITGTARMDAILRSVDNEYRSNKTPEGEAYLDTLRRHANIIDNL